MHRRHSSLVVILAAFGLVALPAAAQAGGALSKVVGGMKQKTRSSGGNGGGGASGGSTSEPSEPAQTAHADGAGAGYWHDPHRAYDPVPVVVMAPYPTGGDDTDVSLYLGLQSVEDSDGAGFVSLRASHDDLGITLEESRYWERIRTPDGMDLLTMDVWGIGLAYRVSQSAAGDTAVWLRGGLAGASSDGLSVLGAAGGAEIAHNINDNIGIEGSTRIIALDDGIRGLEARAGVAASFLRVSYRVMKFNVGPALRGPEFGVGLRF